MERVKAGRLTGCVAENGTIRAEEDLLELGREAGDVKQQMQLNFGLPLNWRTLLKNLNPVPSLRLSAESDL